MEPEKKVFNVKDYGAKGEPHDGIEESDPAPQAPKPDNEGKESEENPTP